MAAPTLVGANPIGQATTGNLTIDLSTVAYQAVDIIVITSVGWVPNTTTGTNTQSLSSPWTKYSPNITLNSPIDGEWAFWWARATSSSSLGTSLTITRPTSWDTGTDTCWAGKAFVFRGCQTSGNPFDTLTASSLFSTANQSIPATTLSGGNRLVSAFLVSSDDQSAGSAPTNWTLDINDSTTAGTDARLSLFTIATSTNTSATATTVAAPAQGRYVFFVASFAPAPITATATGSGTGNGEGRVALKRTASDSGAGTQSATPLPTRIRTATGTGTGNGTGYTYSVYDGPSRTYDELTRIYDGGNSVSASGAGTSNQTSTSGIQYVRTATSSGTGSSSASGVVYVFHARNASGSGAGTESASGTHISPRTATGTGGATAGDATTELLTHVRSIVGVGTGTSSAYGATAQLRTASGSGVGSVIVVSKSTMYRTASSSASGGTDVAIWKNAGKSLVGKVVMPLRWQADDPFYIRD